MSNEPNNASETPQEREAEATTPQAPPRDIIAERLAARQAQQPKREERKREEPNVESPAAEEESEPTIVEQLKAEAEKEEILAEGVASVPMVPDAPPVLRLRSEIERSTESMEVSADEMPKAEASEDGEGDRPKRKSQRERQREKQMQRRAERDARNASKQGGDDQGSLPFKQEAKPEERSEQRVERPERGDRGDRNDRRERGERRDRPERQRPDKPREERKGMALDNRPRIDAGNQAKPQEKPSGNTFQRAKSLASKLGVSVVIPLYNEQESLRELAAAIREELFKLCDRNYEIIFVNDGSTDRSGEILRDMVAGSSRIISLTFRRNVGKSPALAVGFKEAKYGIVITMDADLQDDPKELVNLIAKLDEGYDLVTGWKKKRNDPASKTVPSKFFNMVTSFFAGIKLHDFNCGLKAYRKEVTEALEVYGELHRYLPALAHWKGFRVAEIPVTHHPRKFGKSKFGTSRFFKGFLDLLSIVFVNRYGKRPLHLFGTVGTLLGLVGFAINTYITVEWFQGIPLSNRPILLLGVLLILVGVQLISLGLLGEMIVKNSGKTLEAGYIRDRRPPKKNPRPQQRG
jgi:glycosyltransferase involved in cell wall biosynthesis